MDIVHWVCIFRLTPRNLGQTLARPSKLSGTCFAPLLLKSRMSHGQDPLGSSASLAQVFANAIAGATIRHQQECHPASSSDEGSNHTDSESPIIDYLNSLRLSKINKVHDILSANDINSHKIFAGSSSLDQKEVLSLGLALGVITQLFDNVSKLEKHLARNKFA